MFNCKKQFGLASILFGIGFIIQSLPFAQAYQGPNVGMGSAPYESFSGTINNNQTNTLLTIPANSIFIVTTCITNSTNVDLIKDSSIVLEGGSGVCASSPTTSFRSGNGHLIIDGNSILQIDNSNCCNNYQYYIEGYYAQP